MFSLQCTDDKACDGSQVHHPWKAAADNLVLQKIDGIRDYVYYVSSRTWQICDCKLNKNFIHIQDVVLRFMGILLIYMKASIPGRIPSINLNYNVDLNIIRKAVPCGQ